MRIKKFIENVLKEKTNKLQKYSLGKITISTRGIIRSKKILQRYYKNYANKIKTKNKTK